MYLRAAHQALLDVVAHPSLEHFDVGEDLRLLGDRNVVRVVLQVRLDRRLGRASAVGAGKVVAFFSISSIGAASYLFSAKPSPCASAVTS